jgi:hypothetical protein
MGVHTSAGSKIFMGGTNGAVLLTDLYTEIGEITNIGDFGRTYQEVRHDVLSRRGTDKYKGQFDDGNITLQLGRDPADAGQAKLIAARDRDFDYNFYIEDNDAAPETGGIATISIASPGVVMLTNHGLVVGKQVKFSTTGALPTGFLAGTAYFVKTTPDANTFTASATAGGAAIVTTGTQSGIHSVTDIPTPSRTYFRAKVMSYTNAGRNVNQIVAATTMLAIKSGSSIEVPASV